MSEVRGMQTQQRRRKSAGVPSGSPRRSPSLSLSFEQPQDTRFIVTAAMEHPQSSQSTMNPVAPIPSSALGCSPAMLSPYSMDTLGAGVSDVVVISSNSGTAFAPASVWPSGFVQRGCLRSSFLFLSSPSTLSSHKMAMAIVSDVEIDDVLRKNCAAEPGSKVDINLAKDPPRTPSRVVVEPVDPIHEKLPKNVHISEVADFVASGISGRLFCAGNAFPVKMYGITVSYRIVETVPRPRGPDDVFVIDGSSEVVLRGSGDGSDEVEVDSSRGAESSAEVPKVTFSDVAGVDSIVELLNEAVVLPLMSPETFSRYGIKPPKGVLLCGPSGTGKSLLAQAVAGSCGATAFTIAGSESLSRFVGESEAKLRELFAIAAEHSPAVVIIDEIDALCPARDEAQNEVDKRVVSTLLTLMDGIDVDTKHRVSVVATTNRPNALDPALRRAGRLDKEIEIGVPSRESREAILALHLARSRHSLTKEQIAKVAAESHGFVGADIAALVRTAGLHAFRRYTKSRSLAKDKDGVEAQTPAITLDDIQTALCETRPSAMREVAIEIPRVKWDDIGGHADVKLKLREAVEWPVKHPEVFDAMGINPPCGVLLYGPPGCSKTLMAQALATETGLNFIAVRGPQLLSKYVGDSERAVRAVFKKARQNAPAILFFDEIDGLVGRERGDGREGGSSRVLSQMLTEMDGIQPLRNVAVIAATNRPDMIDKALLRPGRIDRALFLGMPDIAARREILCIHTRKIPHDANDLEKIAMRTEGYSGAEIASLCSTASLMALRESLSATCVEARHWEAAFTHCGPPTTGAISLEAYSQFASTSEVASL